MAAPKLIQTSRLACRTLWSCQAAFSLLELQGIGAQKPARPPQLFLVQHACLEKGAWRGCADTLGGTSLLSGATVLFTQSRAAWRSLYCMLARARARHKWVSGKGRKAGLCE